MGMYTLLYLKWITNKDLLYSTWNSAQCYETAWIGEEFGGEWIPVYVWLSPFPLLFTLNNCKIVHQLHAEIKRSLEKNYQKEIEHKW